MDSILSDEIPERKFDWVNALSFTLRGINNGMARWPLSHGEG
jgi:hypothetical protein